MQFGWGIQKQQMIEALMAYFVIVPLPFANVIETYAKIDDYSRRNGVKMGKNDLWIAATAAVTGERLLTTDKDFDHLDGVYLTRDWVDPVL